MTLNLYILGIKTSEKVDINSRCHACQNILKDQSEMKMIMDMMTGLCTLGKGATVVLDTLHVKS